MKRKRIPSASAYNMRCDVSQLSSEQGRWTATMEIIDADSGAIRESSGELVSAGRLVSFSWTPATPTTPKANESMRLITRLFSDGTLWATDEADLV